MNGDGGAPVGFSRRAADKNSPTYKHEAQASESAQEVSGN